MSAHAQIPPGQESLVQRMLAMHPSVDRCRAVVRRITIEKAAIRATYALPEGRGAVVLLRHPEDVAQASARTLKFAIDVVTRLPDEAHALLEALSRRIRMHEAHFRWDTGNYDDDTSNLEFFALMRGLKPAVRTHLSADDRAHAVRRYERLGFAVEVRPDPFNTEHAFVYAARSRDVVLRMAELEMKETHDAQRELGCILGYPACCVEAFLSRDENPDRSVDELFRAVRAATVPAPYFRLNIVLAADTRSYASFYPCRLDCPHAASLVDTFAAALDRKTRGEVDAALAVCVAVSSRGVRYRVRLERGGDVIVRDVDAVAPGFAEPSFVGRAVIDGLVRVDDTRQLAVIDFASAR